MNCDYRIVKYKEKYGLALAHYDEFGNLRFTQDNVKVIRKETPEELRNDIELMFEALNKPIIDD